MRLAGLVALAGLVSCAHVEPLTVSGEALDATGQTFVATSRAMEQAAKLEAVSPKQYAAWSAFKPKFQASFDLAVQLWKTAREAQDAVLQGHIEQVIQILVDELATYTALVLKLAQSPDGGAR